MSQTAAQINQEILDRLNRGTEIGSDTVYNWMNRVKQRAQNQGSPLDFMYHEMIALAGSGLIVPGGATAGEDEVPDNTFHVREALIVPSGVSQGDLESVLSFDNVTTAFLSATPVFTNNGAAASYTYNAGALTGGVSVAGSPALTWNADHFEMPYVVFSKGGNEYSQIWVGGAQAPPPIDGVLIFDATFPDVGFSHARVATNNPAVPPPNGGNPVTVTDVDPTTQDFNLWLVEFDVTIAGTPAVAQGNVSFRRDAIALPPSFHSLLWARILSGGSVSLDEVQFIYGGLTSPALFYFPTTCITGDGYSTDHVSGAGDLYPFYGMDREFIQAELTERGVATTLADSLLQYDNGWMASREVVPSLSSNLTTSAGPIFVVGEAMPTAMPGLARAVSAMDGIYANPPAASKVLLVSNYDDLYGDTDYRFFHVGMYRTLPDYNKPNQEQRSVPVVTEDIFTRTGEDLLITGTLRLAYRYLNQFDQAEKYEIFERQEQQAFRRAHSSTQSQMGFDELRRLREGTRIVRAI